MSTSAAVTEELLAGLIPLNSLRPETRADLARKAVVISRNKGDHLFRVNEPLESALYLIEGEVELADASGNILAHLRAGTPDATYRIAHQSPRRLSAVCRSPVRCIQLDGQLLDVLLTWDQTDALEVGEVHAGQSSQGDDWMTRLLQMRSFQMVPPANLQAIFMRMQPISAAPGQVIIRQGDPGDYFYVLTEGRCIVTREQPNLKAVRLAELDAGSCFGEEALISDAPRNAAVTMLTQGSLRRLARDDFRTLLNEPLERKLTQSAARAMVAAGEARFLDVRLPSEFMSRALPDSLNLPLYMLRMRLALLDTQKSYICVCDTGRRSSVASFVLTQKGFDTYILNLGLDGAA